MSSWLNSFKLSAVLCLSVSTYAGTDHPDIFITAEEREQLAEAIAAEIPSLDEYDVQMWIFTAKPLISRFNSNEVEQDQILNDVLVLSSFYDVPADLVLAVMEIESHFDRFAISRAGALGLMQIMPFWIDEIGQEDDNLMQINVNIRYGCAILKYYLDRHDNSWHNALAAYNGSLGSPVYPEKVLNAWDARWKYTRVSSNNE